LGRVGELEEENERLEKELIRLEDSEEELKRELKSMKARREEDMRRHYS
jgi:chaperonin cofactor prefoldin